MNELQLIKNAITTTFGEEAISCLAEIKEKDRPLNDGTRWFYTNANINEQYYELNAYLKDNTLKVEGMCLQTCHFPERSFVIA